MSAKLRATGFSSSSGGDAVFDSFYFSADDEAEVAGVLFCLPDLIRKSESTRRFPPCWGAKRRRSVIDAPPELLPVNGKLEYVSSSPTSPLTFSSHAHLDAKHVVSNKEEEKECLKNCGRSIESRGQLAGVNESVSCITDSVEVQLFSRSQPLVHHNHCHQFQPEMGPTGIPDLNVPVEEYAGGMEWAPPPLSELAHYYVAAAVESRAEAAALARQRRHLIQKSKRATRGGR
ncbi:hypothetical protein V2J09_018103 [Rumex salicifolius]